MSLYGRLPSAESHFPSAGGRLPSSGSENGFSSLSRADSDVSESAPLLAAASSFDRQSSSSVSHHQPRMGHAIGYLRRPDKEQSLPLPPRSDPRTHQYQSISDEEGDFGSPLDLGPSLMDEVFSELGNYDTLKLNKDDKKDGSEDHHGIGHNLVDMGHKLADKVSTLTLKKHKGKKAAVVKPIKASDEKTLEKAIKMANKLASKSMQDLDKRGVDTSPQISPLTPDSPTKKFSFKFPNPGPGARSQSPSHGSNVEALITPAARDAYKALIEGGKEAAERPEPLPVIKSSSVSSMGSVASNRLSLPPSSSIFSSAKVSLSSQTLDPDPLPSQGFSNDPPNPIPLPPKEGKSHVTVGKRHIRKNPLILTSGAAASMARRFETEAEPGPPPTAPVRTKNTHQFSVTNNDAFEEEIAFSIAALDDIPEARYTSPKTSACSGTGDPDDEPPGVSGHQRSAESDEVRIMAKVLGGMSADPANCVKALDLTDWNVHRAIKIVKLKALVRKPGVEETDMKVALINHEWDLTKAAGEING